MEFPVESPDEALARLIEGNERFANNKSKSINESNARREKVAERQRPFATIFSCVDSRVPPELIFDRGLGDLFVIRTAGEVIDHAVMGSLEYGAYELEIPLLMVLGHKKCGAVKATLETVEAGGKVDGDIGYLIEAIRPAIGSPKKMALVKGVSINAAAEPAKPAADHGAEAGGHEAAPSEVAAEAAPAGETTDEPFIAETEPFSEETVAEDHSTDDHGTGDHASEEIVAEETTPEEEVVDEAATEEEVVEETTEDGEPVEGAEPPDHLTEAIKRNVELVVERISKSAIIAERVKKDRLRVIGGIYDLETGLVELTVNIPEKFIPVEVPTTEG